MGIGGRDSGGTDPTTEAEVFSERVRAQLAAHGAIARIALGEAFHRIDAT
jgi:hypothetical protein